MLKADLLEDLNLSIHRIFRFLKTGSFKTKEVREYIKFFEENSHNYKTAFFNLTIDFELAWSRARRGDSSTTLEESLERSRRARNILPCLVELTKRYNIPVTIAFVAHAAIPGCASHKVPPKFSPSWIKTDWFSIDPMTNIEKNKEYYGSDLIKMVLDSGVDHEIASHGFSHIDLSDTEVSSNVAEYEIMESYRILREIDPGLTTFIFPKNNQNFIEIIKNAGYTIYRGKKNKEIVKDNFGLWCFPCGLWLSPESSGPKEINSMISLAIKEKKLFNVWCHLYEFKDAEQFKRFFIPIFEFIKTKRSEGNLQVNTIRSIISNINNERC